MIRSFRRQSGQFFIRVRILDELHAAAGKQLYSKPLGTDDPAEAQRRWPAAVAAYDATLREWRCAANRVSLTPDEAAELATIASVKVVEIGVDLPPYQWTRVTALRGRGDVFHVGR
jgi:hypothetical protein